MSNLSRHRDYLVWGAVALALSIVLTLLLAPSGTVAIDQRRSISRTTPDGVAAWARSLEALGVRVEPRFTDLDSDRPEGAGLALLEPLVDLSAREVHRALEYVRGGGTLIFAPGFVAPLRDSLDYEIVALPPDPYGFTMFRDSLVVHPWTEEARGWEASRVVRVEVVDEELVDDWEPLAVGEMSGSSLSWLRLGEGGILFVADGRELSNGLLADSEIALATTRAVVDLIGDGTLYFSEYHLGIGSSRGLMRESITMASEMPVGRIFLHLLVTAAALVIFAARRFGQPLPPPPAPRRSTVEHVNAVAHIYRAAQSDRTVANHLVRAAARRAGLPMDAEGAEPLVRRWSHLPRLDEPAGAALVALAVSPPDLPALEAALDDLVQRHLSPRNAI